MYTARTILNRNKYFFALLIMWVGGMCFAEGAKAQTVIYGQYVGPAPANTGGSGGAGGSAGLGGSVGAVGSYSIVNPTYLNDAIYTNYAEVKATSGAPGSGRGQRRGIDGLYECEFYRGDYTFSRQSHYHQNGCPRQFDHDTAD